MVPYLSSRLRTKWGWWIVLAAVVVLVLFLVFNAWVIPQSFETTDRLPEHKCHWTPSDPIFYNIHTKLGVNYDGGHWFHMAENIMTMHSVLRAQNRLANASTVYFNFDEKDFASNLNGMTRFITYLGIVAPGVPVRSLRFFSDQRLWHTASGESVKYDQRQHHGHADQWLSLSSDIPNSDRFVKLSPVPASSAPSGPSEAPTGDICIKHGGQIGGKWPTIQRGHWFPNSGDVDSFRAKIQSVCSTGAARTASNRRKLVIYQRDLSRKLLNQAPAIDMLRSTLSGDWDIQVVMHVSSRSPCALYELLQDADVLLTPHGFQSMLLILMAPGKLLFEVFPYRYYKPAYSPFGREFGVHHGGVMSEGTSWFAEHVLPYTTTATCMVIKQCRVHSRDQDVM